MLPTILDKQFNKLGVIDDYLSFIWTERYYASGDFELCLPVTEKTVEIIRRNYYVMREDSEEIGIIETVDIKRDDETAETMIVSGRFLVSILARRIIADQIQVSGTAPSCVRALLNANAINPSIDIRRIQNLLFDDRTTVLTNMKGQYTGKPLLETIEEICELYGLGVTCHLTSDKKFEVVMYNGSDRSINQSVNPRVIFSDEYDNLLSSEYIESTQELTTDALVAGEGEGLDRRTLWTSRTSKAGLERYEIYVDARDLQSDNGAVSPADYEAQLRERGLEAIHEITQAFAGTVYLNNLKYNQDVYMGDICTIHNSRWGIAMNARLIEVIESMAEDGSHSIIPTFGI